MKKTKKDSYICKDGVQFKVSARNRWSMKHPTDMNFREDVDTEAREKLIKPRRNKKYSRTLGSQ
jgi:hypothetical protein